jgi:hypothetical protein
VHPAISQLDQLLDPTGLRRVGSKPNADDGRHLGAALRIAHRETSQRPKHLLAIALGGVPVGARQDGRKRIPAIPSDQRPVPR